MNCPNCGARLSDGASFCERCGSQVGIPQFTSSQLRPQPTSDKKILWIVVLVVILVIVVPIILAAVMYVMVLGFGDGTENMTPAAVYDKGTITNGKKVTVLSISRIDVPWDDVAVQLSDDMNFATWSPSRDDMSVVGGRNYSSQSLGSLSVYMWAFDLQGNGFLSGGDYVTFQTIGASFSSDTTYSVRLIYQPTGETMGIPVIFNG